MLFGINFKSTLELPNDSNCYVLTILLPGGRLSGGRTTFLARRRRGWLFHACIDINSHILKCLLYINIFNFNIRHATLPYG